MLSPIWPISAPRRDDWGACSPYPRYARALSPRPIRDTRPPRALSPSSLRVTVSPPFAVRDTVRVNPPAVQVGATSRSGSRTSSRSRSPSPGAQAASIASLEATLAQVRRELTEERRLRAEAEKAVEAERGARAEAEESAARVAAESRTVPAPGRSVRDERKEASALESEAQRERERSRALRARNLSLQAEKQALAEERDRAVAEAADLRRQNRALRNKKRDAGPPRKETAAPPRAALRAPPPGVKGAVGDWTCHDWSAGLAPLDLEPADVVANLEEVTLDDAEADLEGRTALSPVQSKAMFTKTSPAPQPHDGEENQACVSRAGRRLVVERPVIQSRPSLPGPAAKRRGRH